jgi:hypothetical protein
MHVRTVTIGIVVASAAAAPIATASSPTHTATDHISGLNYSLKGKQLTLHIVAKHRSRALAAGPKVRGHGVQVTCGTAAAVASPKPNNPNVARGSLRWSARATTVRLTLSRNLYAKARWCTVYRGGQVVSNVDFKLRRNPLEG